VPSHSPIYDRGLLLAGNKRNAVLTLREVQRYGTDSYGDPDYVCLYGMRPMDWYAKGVRLLGRTAVECTRDDLAAAIATDVAAAVGASAMWVVDLFAGSGNTLFWLLRHLPNARGLGFEIDPQVFALTRQNLALLEVPIEISNADFRSGLGGVAAPGDQWVVVFIAPPWGGALNMTTGLDLRRTTPPIREVVDFLRGTFPHNRVLCAVQIYETLEPTSLAELKTHFDRTTLRIYPLNVPGQNHGILLGEFGIAD
jgi:hypothetical protein